MLNNSNMKSAKLIFAFITVMVLASFTSSENGCRNFNWGTSEADVKARETSNFVEEKPSSKKIDRDADISV